MTLVQASGAVTLVGAGPVDAERLAAVLRLAPVAVAADGGADVPLPEGARFRAVIGDMDSVTRAEALRAEGVAFHPIAEQDGTDLEKCLRSIAAPLILGLGFLGGRTDHHLAAMNALVRFADRRVVLIGREDVCLLCPKVLTLDLPAGTRVSFFPMGLVRGLVSHGLRWPVTELAFVPDGRIGTSNIALGGSIRVGFDRPRMLAILPVAVLDRLLEAIRTLDHSA